MTNRSPLARPLDIRPIEIWERDMAFNSAAYDIRRLIHEFGDCTAPDRHEIERRSRGHVPLAAVEAMQIIIERRLSQRRDLDPLLVKHIARRERLCRFGCTP